MFQLSILLLSFSLISFSSQAAEYPDMMGTWKGHIRTVSSGSAQVARGGAVISEIDLKLTMDHQDGETYIGKFRTSTMTKDDRSIRVWGAIRSNGEEASFITGGGGRGQLWFMGPGKFEYCVTNMQDEVMTAYCGILNKDQQD